MVQEEMSGMRDGFVSVRDELIDGDRQLVEGVEQRGQCDAELRRVSIRIDAELPNVGKREVAKRALGGVVSID